MEQQTVSIAKAGITTSLSGRTAILGAANPAWGKYNMRTPAANIIYLLWLTLDRADMERALEMTRHVVHVHQNLEWT
ncbi:unnamed protein product [Urochloa humidicola]